MKQTIQKAQCGSIAGLRLLNFIGYFSESQNKEQSGDCSLFLPYI